MVHSTTADPTQAPVVTCLIGTQIYALPLNSVLQVIRLPALIALTGAPPAVCGLLNLRGELLPVLAGRLLLEMPIQCDLNSQVLIIADDDGNAALGLLVDEVYQVRRFGVGSFTPLEQGDKLVCGALRSREETALFIDPQMLFQKAV